MEHIGKAIANVLRSIGPDPMLERILVISAWENCAGPLLAKQTKAVEFADQRLTIAVKDETWQKHLVELTPQLVAKLSLKVGEGMVTFIDIVVDPLVFGDDGSSVVDIDERPPVDISETVIAAAANIESDELRAAYLDFSERMKRIAEMREPTKWTSDR